MTMGFSRGPTRPTGRNPHSSKEGIYSTNVTLFKQRYRRQLFLGMSSSSGTPVGTSSTVPRASRVSPDS